MKKSVLSLAPRLIPISSKEEAMLTEALGLIDYFHPHMRKQAMDFAKRANLQKAIRVLGNLEQKRTDDYQRATAPTLFDMESTEGILKENAEHFDNAAAAFDIAFGKKGR